MEVIMTESERAEIVLVKAKQLKASIQDYMKEHPDKLRFLGGYLGLSDRSRIYSLLNLLDEIA
jgi:hypothetical protein